MPEHNIAVGKAKAVESELLHFCNKREYVYPCKAVWTDGHTSAKSILVPINRGNMIEKAIKAKDN